MCDVIISDYLKLIISRRNDIRAFKLDKLINSRYKGMAN
jgi:hypothetical protein